MRAALREAEEETGLDPAGVQLFGVLPKLYIPVSGFVVSPVLAWWREPSPVGVVDPNETARVFTVPVADLTDPANRVTTIHPSGHRGPAFLVRIGARVGLHRRHHRPVAALRGLGAALGQGEAGPAGLAVMTG